MMLNNLAKLKIFLLMKFCCVADDCFFRLVFTLKKQYFGVSFVFYPKN
jgi:hypothetical protein